MQTARPSSRRIRSALSSHFACNLGGSLTMIFRMLSGPLILLEYPVALRVLVQPDSKMENPSKDSTSSALMRGPLLSPRMPSQFYASGQIYAPRTSLL